MKSKFLLSVFFAAAFGNANAVTVYTQDFESGVLGAEWSGAGTIQSTQGLSAYGFGAQHLKNDGQTASTLNLTGLAAHTSMTLSFSLAMWDSIDFGSDMFQTIVDGGFVINETFGNYYPASGSAGPGTLLTPPTSGAFADPQFGYNAGFRDSARAVSITFAHSLASAAISFQFPNSQFAPDEAFGIDNVIISTDAAVQAPAPGTLALLGLALAGLAVRRRAG